MVSEPASPSDDCSTLTLYADLEDPDSYQDAVEKALEDESVDEVIVYDTTLQENNLICESDTGSNEDNLLVPFAEPQISAWIYSVSNIKKAADYTGTNLLASADGEPGMKLEMKLSKTVSHTFNTTVSLVPNKKINTSVGFGSSLSTTVSITNSMTVPTKANGKNVKKMSLKAYPIYQTKTYSIIGQRTVLGKVEKVTKGTGKARKPCGVSFKKTYTYK